MVGEALALVEMRSELHQERAIICFQVFHSFSGSNIFQSVDKRGENSPSLDGQSNSPYHHKIGISNGSVQVITRSKCIGVS